MCSSYSATNTLLLAQRVITITTSQNNHNNLRRKWNAEQDAEQEAMVEALTTTTQREVEWKKHANQQRRTRTTMQMQWQTTNATQKQEHRCNDEMVEQEWERSLYGSDQYVSRMAEEHKHKHRHNKH